MNAATTSKRSKLYAYALGFAALVFLTALVMVLTGKTEAAGPVFIFFFSALALGFRGFSVLKAFSYTIMIFAAVTTALYYPGYFLEFNGFRFATLITPLIQLIMFGMGTEMGLKDFAGVVKMPKAVLIGLTGQFTVMPLLGFALAKTFGFPPEIAAGVVLIGSMPCGLASNVMSYLANANLALSITLTAFATLLAPLMTPLWMEVLGGQFIEVNAVDMMWDIVKMVILPIGGGLLFNQLFRGKVAWLDKAMPLVSMFGIAFIIVIITASGRNNLLAMGPALVVCALLHNTSGYLFGYWIGKLFGLPERDCRTIAIEVGMQNGGLASGLAKEMGKAATIGLAPAVFGPLMNITGSILVSYWHRKPTPEKVMDKKETLNPVP
jgi:bile acid:Na+ symporter, BASS family